MIDPKKTYSKYEIILLGVLGKTEPTVRKRILEDLRAKNVMETRVVGEGREKRYFVKGENLIKFLEGVTVEI